VWYNDYSKEKEVWSMPKVTPTTVKSQVRAECFEGLKLALSQVYGADNV
jgi:hypothetical protein